MNPDKDREVRNSSTPQYLPLDKTIGFCHTFFRRG
jgi:hypothetical protein